MLSSFPTRPGQHIALRLPTGACSRTLLCLLLCPGCRAAQAQRPGTAQEVLPPTAVGESFGQDTGQTSGQISGLVTDTQGALVSGAQIVLQPARGATAQVTLSGKDGTFALPAVAPGPFTVTVNATGFTAAVTTGTLLPGQHFEMATLVLQPATVNVTVNAVTSAEELATEQLHTEEQQRLLGVFPNFFVTYDWNAAPLSPKQKFALSWKNVIDPGNLFLVGTTAGIQQADNAFPGYHQGAAGYGKRYGADLGNLVSGTFLGGAILPVLFHQDPRYFYKGTGTVRARALYAISRAVVCRGDDGRRQIAYASILGDLSAGAISNLYYAPSDRQGATLTFENGFLGVAGDALNNLFEEFVLRRLTAKSKDKPAPTP